MKEVFTNWQFYLNLNFFFGRGRKEKSWFEKYFGFGYCRPSKLKAKRWNSSCAVVESVWVYGDQIQIVSLWVAGSVETVKMLN